MYHPDPRTVLTLDAGGTNFVFSAISGGRPVTDPVSLPAAGDNLKLCLERIAEGFEAVMALLPEPPTAISFAFPGPADYAHGIIGDLPNLPAFRGGVALGPYLEARFGMPVFINNDGSLFAYGESIAGALPQINDELAAAGSHKRYRNLLGLTLGTGFGCGAVVDGRLCRGDNGCGGDIWVFRNMRHTDMIVEESVSIRAVMRHYREFASSDFRDEKLTPKDIFDIAEGVRPGDQSAAHRAFEEMGTVAGDSIASALTIIDGAVVIGGGLAGAAKYFMPALVAQLNSTIGMWDGRNVPRMESRAFNMEDSAQHHSFINDPAIRSVRVPHYGTQVEYFFDNRIPVMISSLGASRAISLGAWAFALNELDRQNV